jgi:transcriptional regulator with XRE-family HTH domain
MTPIELKILRIRAGLTQHEVGLHLEIPSYEVSRYETGRTQLPPDKLTKLLAILKAETGRSNVS